MPEAAVEPIVPYSSSIEEFQATLKAKAEFRSAGLYPRDGSFLLGEVEAKLANLAGVSENDLLAYGSGMAAVTDAIDISLLSGEGATRTLACAQELYSQTSKHVGFWQRLGVTVRYFDSGDRDSVARAFERQPDVIVAETISNYSGVSVLDTDFFLDSLRQSDKKPTVVIDNTLPLSTTRPLAENLLEDDPVIVAESGSKAYIFNSGLLGLAYSKNPELLERLRHYRRQRGSLPSPQSQEHINVALSESRKEFDERNLRIFKNTGDIALRLATRLGVNESIGSPDEFIISHPALPIHDNHDLYSEIYPEQATPVFYILSKTLSQYQVADLLWRHPFVKEQARIIQSFGFDFTAILTDENTSAVRIGGGADTDGEALGEAMAEALERL